jgi:hypothetical protein
LLHLDDLDLIRYARLTEAERGAMRQAAEHLASCAQCADELSLIEEWLGSEGADLASSDRLPSLTAEILYRRARLGSRTIALVPVITIPAPARLALAADGQGAPSPGWQHRATLYSESPEVVLRIMRDPHAGKDLLQLTGTDPGLTRHVCVHLAEPSMDFFTDHRGIAEVATGVIDDPSSLHWQIRLPDATFTLSPLTLGSPDQAPMPETVLEAEGGHRVAATLVADEIGMTVKIRALSISGHDDFSQVRVVVSQEGGKWRIGEAHSSRDTVSAQVNATEPIEIRLFLV